MGRVYRGEEQEGCGMEYLVFVWVFIFGRDGEEEAGTYTHPGPLFSTLGNVRYLHFRNRCCYGFIRHITDGPVAGRDGFHYSSI